MTGSEKLLGSVTAACSVYPGAERDFLQTPGIEVDRRRLMGKDGDGLRFARPLGRDHISARGSGEPEMKAAMSGLLGNHSIFSTEGDPHGNAVVLVFRDGPSAIENLTAMLPLSVEQATRLLSGIRDSIVANLYGILAVGFAQGLLTGIACAVLHVPSALLLGLAAAVCSLVPIVGTMLVWLPAAFYLMATGHLWKGIILILWGTLVVGTIDNIIRPLVIGSKVELHPLLLLFALLGGLQVFGFIGIFIGPVVISVIAALINILREELAASPKDAPPIAASVS